MLAAPRSKAIRETPKILLIDWSQDCDHGLLNNLVFQCRDAEWPLSAIRFRNVLPSRWLRLISATVDPAVQVGKPTLQPGLILFPCDAIHSRRGLTLQHVKAI